MGQRRSPPASQDRLVATVCVPRWTPSPGKPMIMARMPHRSGPTPYFTFAAVMCHGSSLPCSQMAAVHRGNAVETCASSPSLACSADLRTDSGILDTMHLSERPA